MDAAGPNTDIMALAGKVSGGAGLSAGSLLAGLVFSGVGLFYLKNGKRDGDFFTLAIGIALLVFPYVVTDTLYMVLTGAALIGYHYYRTHYE